MEYLEVVEAGKFWEADENDFFTLPQIAFALGIGRNKMCKVPVARMIIEKRACYRKGDILDWALSEDGKKTLNQLKNENTKIGRAIKARTKAYDRYYANDPQSYYCPSNSINETKQDKYNRLQHEWHDVRHRLFVCYDDEELKKPYRNCMDYARTVFKIAYGIA